MFFWEKKHLLFSVFFLLILFGASIASPADPDYPIKPITLVVGFPPGGSIDVTARALTNDAKKHLGEPIIVENKGGGGGMVGPALVAVKPPDGYTIGVVGSTAAAVAWHMGKANFNPFEDVTHIMRYTGLLFGLAVRTDSPFKTVQDLLKYGRENPGKISYGTSGVGTTGHLAMEDLLLQAGGLQMTHIPYKGGGESIPALLGGHIDVLSDASGWAPMVDAGKFRLLAVYSGERSSRYPQVPTIREIGYDVVYNSPMEIFGPKGMSKAVVKKLHEAFQKAMEDSTFEAVLKKFDMPLLYLGGEELEKTNQRDFERMNKVVQKLGLQKK